MALAVARQHGREPHRLAVRADVPNPEQVLIREVSGSPVFGGATAFE